MHHRKQIITTSYCWISHGKATYYSHFFENIYALKYIYIYIYTKWYYENSEWLNIKITIKISHRTHPRDIWSWLTCTLMANPTTVNRDHYCPLSLPHITEMYVLNRNDAILMKHYSDIIMSTIASQITSRTIAYPTIFQAQIIENIKALCHWPRWPVNTPHKGPVTWIMFPFDDVIMIFDTGSIALLPFC